MTTRLLRLKVPHSRILIDRCTDHEYRAIELGAKCLQFACSGQFDKQRAGENREVKLPVGAI